MVELKHVDLRRKQRAMARAEPERARAARSPRPVLSRGSKALAEAAVIIAANPVTLQLRYLQTLTEVATEKNSTIIFPLPIDLIRAFLPSPDART